MSTLIGPHRAETAKIDMDTALGITHFKENLRINATLYFEEKSGKFLEKKVCLCSVFRRLSNFVEQFYSCY